MDIQNSEMEFDLILLRRRPRKLFVRPVGTNERREDVTTYAQPKNDMSAHGPVNNKCLSSPSIEPTTRARRMIAETASAGSIQPLTVCVTRAVKPAEARKGTIYELRRCITTYVQRRRAGAKPTQPHHKPMTETTNAGPRLVHRKRKSGRTKIDRGRTRRIKKFECQFECQDVTPQDIPFPQKATLRYTRRATFFCPYVQV